MLYRSKSYIVPLLLREVPPERVTVMEELGQGAFGKVHKGVLKELPKAEVFFKPREQRVQTNEGQIVAIKVLIGEQIYVQLGVHERNLSTRVFVGILGPIWSNRQYRIVSIDQIKSPCVVFTNFKNPFCCCTHICFKMAARLKKRNKKQIAAVFFHGFALRLHKLYINFLRICKHDTGRF